MPCHHCVLLCPPPTATSCTPALALSRWEKLEKRERMKEYLSSVVIQFSQSPTPDFKRKGKEDLVEIL
jgi:hypothetical protein